MDDSFLVLLAIGALLAIPTIAIIALVRTGRLRRRLEEASSDFGDKINDLKGEIVGLRRDLSQLSRRVDQPVAVAPQTAPVKASVPELRIEPAIHHAEGAAPPPLKLQAALVPEPLVFLKQSTPSAPPPLSKPEVVVVHDKQIASAVVDTAPAAAANEEEWLQYIAKRGATLRKPGTSIKDEYEQFVAARAARQPETPHVAAPAMPALTAPSIAAPPRFASFEAAPPRKSFAERLRTTLPLEELLGMNLFAKIGIVLLVLGFALGGKLALVSMGPAARVALIYAASVALLIGGIWLERKERYRIVGRAGIGGGWATLFFTTYAMYHVPAMTVMASNTLNCVLMLGVAIAMVAHTLRYKSQVVTGLAFLLAFSTIALSQDSVYALSAGVILAAGIVAIALRMGWFELEVFGILASYANHFYWLYRLFPDGVAGHQFPQFWPSAIILIFYWAIFRVSYIVRTIRLRRDESISTIAALLNTMLLGAVMKFQSTRPELAFYGILAIGVAEFIFGQLPITRRRRPAFVLLTVIGTLLIFAAVPFKFSGNNIALFWMIAAEVLLKYESSPL